MSKNCKEVLRPESDLHLIETSRPYAFVTKDCAKPNASKINFVSA
ncbi:MAG: hypothetical protein QOF74_5408 [Caballeronia mineralivorans]|jgi:hypothetical protein|nr:hypothetical protein [Caballeronia mineralivorans]